MARKTKPQKLSGRKPRETPLRSLRLARGLAADRVADAAGITVEHLGNMERGAEPVGRFSAYGLARAYKLTEEQIYDASARTVALARRRKLARDNQR